MKNLGQKRKDREKVAKTKVLKRRQQIRAKAKRDKTEKLDEIKTKKRTIKEAKEQLKIEEELRKIEKKIEARMATGENSDFINQNLEKLKQMEKKNQEEEQLKIDMRDEFLKKRSISASADVIFKPKTDIE